MPSADKREYPDELLTRYLLGAAKASESEQLDELSIVDNELAWRLDALEQDLVDAFVRNELFGETLERFEKHYLSSPARREKVEIARTLLKCNEKRVSEKRVAGGKRVEAVASAKQLTAARFDWLRSGLAGAAIALCALAAYLFVENNRLRKLRTDAQIQQAILDQQNDGTNRSGVRIRRKATENDRRAPVAGDAGSRASGECCYTGRYGAGDAAHAAGIR